MRIHLTLISILVLTFSAVFFLGEVQASEDTPQRILLAQAGPMEKSSVPPKRGCRAIKVHCQCVNPTKDFVVPNQPVGKANPGAGQKGECMTSKEIDARADQMPIAYCLRGEASVKDVRKGESRCKATWTCVEPCTIGK